MIARSQPGKITVQCAAIHLKDFELNDPQRARAMSEFELAEALQPIQLRLFELQAQVRQICYERKRLKREAAKLIAQGRKLCRKCRHEMDAEQFYRDKRNRDGLSTYCRECKSEATARRRLPRELAA